MAAVEAWPDISGRLPLTTAAVLVVAYALRLLAIYYQEYRVGHATSTLLAIR